MLSNILYINGLVVKGNSDFFRKSLQNIVDTSWLVMLRYDLNL